QMTPQYTASTQVLLNNQSEKVVDFEAVLSGLPADSATVDSQVQVILSRSIAQRVIEKLNLLQDPEFNSEVTGGGIGSLVTDALNWAKSVFSIGTVEQTEEQKEETILTAAVNEFISREEVKRVGLTYLMTISFTSRDPAKASKIA